MTDAPSRDVHHAAASFVVALSTLVELQRGDRLTNADAEHQGAYAVEAVRMASQAGMPQLQVSFTAGVPFVRRCPLQAAPWVFRKIEPLVAALREHGWYDLRIDPAVRPGQVVSLAACIAAPAGDQDATALPPNVSLGAEVFEDLATVLPIDSTSPATTLARAYAAMVAALWDAQGTLARNELPDLTRMMRAAQVAVELADTRRLATATPTALRVNDDRAARWVDTSILAAEMCRFVTPERRVRRAVALATLLLSLAPFDERGAASQDGPPSVSRGRRLIDPGRLAARTLGLIIAVPRAAQGARLAASLAYEAQLRRYRFLGSSPEPNGQGSMEAVLIATAIRFFELRAKQRGDDVIDDVMHDLRAEAADERDEVALRLLMAAMGVLPRGAVVELDTREVARVVSPAREGMPPEPELEILVDSRGTALDSPVRCDLAAPANGDEPRRSVRTVLALTAEGNDQLPKAGTRDRVAPGRPKLAISKSKRSGSDIRQASRKKKAPNPRPSRPPGDVVLGPEIIEDLVSKDRS